MKLYPGDDQSHSEPLSPRADILIQFLTGHTSVSLKSLLRGDYVDRPIRYQVNPLVFITLRNGAVTQDGFVFTEHNELLRESVDRRAYLNRLATAHPALDRELVDTPVEESPKAVAILACQRSANYFHWWIDVLARCWLLSNSPYRACQPVTPPLTHDFQRESLSLLKQKVSVMTRPLQRFPSVVFTRGLTYGSSQDIAPQVNEFAQWCRATLELPPSPARRKLFLSRKSARSRSVVNEPDLLAALGSDFECVELESMSVREQAALFSEASVIVAPHGAGLANLLFCDRPVAVVELMHAGAPPPYNYRRLAGLLGHQYMALACESEGTHREITRRELRPAVPEVVDAVRRIQEVTPDIRGTT